MIEPKALTKGALARRKADGVDARTDAVLLAESVLDTRPAIAAHITALWTDVQRRFLLIGRDLERARQILPHGEYEAMVDQDLPFGASTARQLRTVAAAVDGGRLPADRLPPRYTTLYQLATLPDQRLREADAAGLIRPDVSRQEVRAFARAGIPAEDWPPRLAAMHRRRDKLRAALAKIETEIAAMEDEADDFASVPDRR